MQLPLSAEMRSHSDVPLAIVLDDVQEQWQTNVLQIRGRPDSASVKVDGYGTIVAAAFVLSPEQARHLATQIIEILGLEDLHR